MPPKIASAALGVWRGAGRLIWLLGVLPVVGALVRVAERPRDEVGVPALLREFEGFLAGDWARHVWVELLALSELRSLWVFTGLRYAPMDPRRLPESSYGEYRYVLPSRGCAAALTITSKYSSLEIRYESVGGMIFSEESSLHLGHGVAKAMVAIYRHGGLELIEGLAGVAASKGAPEVARALETTAGLYRASEPYVAAELASDPGEPPEEFREHVVSEVLPRVRLAGDSLEADPDAEVLKDIAPPDHHISVGHAVVHFKYQLYFADQRYRALRAYKVAKAAKAVLRVALAMGLLE